MKRAVYTVVTVLLIAWLDATANTQSAQDPSEPCASKATGCVRVEYDRFKDTTTVLMTPVLLVPNYGYGSVLESIQMMVTYSSPGKVMRRPEKALFLFAATDRHNTGQEPMAFRKSRDVDLLIDGVSRPLGGVDIVGRKLNESDIFFPTWTYSLEVPFDVVENIAVAKRVELRAGSVETTLDEASKAAFRRLVELTPKREGAASPAQEKVAPREVKRPRRRRSRP